MIQDVSTCYF